MLLKNVNIGLKVGFIIKSIVMVYRIIRPIKSKLFGYLP